MSCGERGRQAAVAISSLSVKDPGRGRLGVAASESVGEVVIFIIVSKRYDDDFRRLYFGNMTAGFFEVAYITVVRLRMAQFTELTCGWRVLLVMHVCSRTGRSAKVAVVGCIAIRIISNPDDRPNTAPKWIRVRASRSFFLLASFDPSCKGPMAAASARAHGLFFQTISFFGRNMSIAEYSLKILSVSYDRELVGRERMKSNIIPPLDLLKHLP
ncbi:uncharacterized protein FOMMEDRAFT_149928 [Fomitiporia mediterranea MF3/22]|uniref:uncharacterized protein n=1 Tax=Fomitiporia mediterranea (strain MF3/22) TaxID=694068 RepID=UPI0004407C62|nr:uncharacterized protein FOMMEDRAFT_149928 [Fomitiporia mediterranea MF3/22]EJD07403.1 hypothetical protein FOMMEDRAFT_149928 [Fomitiporia mediterranea MF3/22]